MDGLHLSIYYLLFAVLSFVFFNYISHREFSVKCSEHLGMNFICTLGL
jgi:hypothetical protein